LRSLIGPGVLAGAVLLLALGGATHVLGTAKADDSPAKSAGSLKSPTGGAGSHNLVLGSKDSAQPKNMEEFLTAVTKDVDGYWTNVFKSSGLKEPRVGYTWIPAGQTAKSACGDADGAMGDSAAAYCSGDDTIYISQKFATDLYNGALNQVLPGSSQGFGRAAGDFAVAYVVAHEYGHEVQDELGLFQKYGNSLPAMAFELQADCYAGNWAKSAYDENKLDDGDIQEALDAALAVGDFDTNNPQHHGTPDQREAAWNSGFESGDPSTCDKYLDPSNLGDDGTASQQQDPTQQQDPYGDPTQQQDPYGDPTQQQDPYGDPTQQQDPGYGYPQDPQTYGP
jgi:hypothetical protein